MRIRRGLDFDLNTGMPTPNLHKDIKVQGELLEALGGFRGRTGGIGRPSKLNAPVGEEAQQALKKIDSGEQQLDKMQGLLKELAPLLMEKQNA
jgi:hypothetical protein